LTRTHTPDAATVKAVRAIAASLPLQGELRLEGAPFPLPPAVAAMLRDMLATIAAGEPVALVTADSELSPQEAAEMLNVSRHTITKLMDDGALPFRLVGSHRRLPAAAVAAYKLKQQAKARAAMDELVSLSQAAGDYANPPDIPPKRAFRGQGRDD
jgi:excisionase family DNA binding protein